uniref:Uncharacterized protein n=1 Tax=viral metagenome TaxID=1070528 RepID=A0A6M3LDZ4_9ZZZZ
MTNGNSDIKKGCGHLGNKNHEDHYCYPKCVFQNESITHPECRNCSITLNLPVKKCYFEV